MIDYVIKVILLQALFLGLYDFFLGKETFFQKNRVYLLTTFLGSFLLPLITIPTFQEVVSEEISIVLPEIILSPQKTIEQTFLFEASEASVSYGTILFWLGASVFLVLFILKLSRLIGLIRKNAVVRQKDYSLIVLPGSQKAFSFFNYIFLGEKIKEEERDKIIAHELVHWKQKHTVDLVLFEVFKVMMWFNPMVFVYQRRVSLIHEFLSDSAVVKEHKKEKYINRILSEFFEVEKIAFVNQFYKKSLLKKRIFMLTRERSEHIKQWKYLLLLPMLFTMLVYVSCNGDSVRTESESSAMKTERVFYRSNGKTGDQGKLLSMYKDLTGKTNFQPLKSYFDIYYDKVAPPFGDKITKNDLKEEERQELDEFLSRHEKNGYGFWSQVDLYQLENGRKMIAIVWDLSMENAMTGEKYQEIQEDVPFAVIDETPVFPGCTGTEIELKRCFSKKIQTHFVQRFNTNLVGQLNLSKGKKRIIMQFKIDKSGVVTGINVRAPHSKLEEEATKILKQLPDMKPGKQGGKEVAVQYTLPLRIDVN